MRRVKWFTAAVVLVFAVIVLAVQFGGRENPRPAQAPPLLKIGPAGQAKVTCGIPAGEERPGCVVAWQELLQGFGE